MNKFNKATKIFQSQGGILRSAEAGRLGVNPRYIYEMKDNEIIDQIARGLYRLSSLPPLTNPDLVTISKLISKGVICLNSALSFHRLKSGIPQDVHLALKKGTVKPKIKNPSIRAFWYSVPSYNYGIQEHKVDGVLIKIYSPEKTVADCFKYRNRKGIGLKTALDALKRYRQSDLFDLKKLLEAAAVCRVEKIMRPYIEAIL